MVSELIREMSKKTNLYSSFPYGVAGLILILQITIKICNMYTFVLLLAVSLN